MSKIVHRMKAVEDQAATSKFILRYFFGPIMRSVAIDDVESSTVDKGYLVGTLNGVPVVTISTAAPYEVIARSLLDPVSESQDQEEWLENQQEMKMFQERVDRTLRREE